MLKADSSTLNSESELHASVIAPMIPSVRALSCTASTARTIWSTELAGKSCCSSVTR